MAEVKPVRTEADYVAALARIDDLLDAEPGTPEGEELDVLADLVEVYESRHVPIDYPSPVAAIEFRMDQTGLAPRDLVPFIGTRAKVSEVLSGKRSITMPMAPRTTRAPRNTCRGAAAGARCDRRPSGVRRSVAPVPAEGNGRAQVDSVTPQLGGAGRASHP